MKQLFYGLLIGLLVIASGTVGVAHSLFVGGTGEIHIVIPKQGSTSFYFSIPEEYLDKNGELTIPLEINLIKDKEVLFSVQCIDKMVVLPQDLQLQGTYYVTLNIGAYQSVNKVSW